MKPAMKIFFIGMPGAGKTTIGKQVALALDVRFIDLDEEIVLQERITIPEIFKSKGEDHFRLVESSLLKRWADSNDNFVMATGGGAPCFFNGINVINNSGVSVFLNASIPTLVERLKNKSDRPLLSSSSEQELISTLEKTVSARISAYRKASIVVDDPTVETVLKMLDVKR
jgi:shikimate kinase